MNIKDNQRSRITKLIMKEAYLKILSNKQSSNITVKEICENAQINRSTFYLHYNEPNDILKELENETIKMVSDYLQSIGKLKEADLNLKEYIVSFLRYVQKNDEVFRTFLIENNDPHFKRKLFDLALSFMINDFSIPLPSEHKVLIYHFIVSGCIDVLCEWISSNYKTSEYVIADLLNKLCQGSIASTYASF